MHFNAVRHVVDITQPTVPTEQQLENQLHKKMNLKLRKAKVCVWFSYIAISCTVAFDVNFIHIMFYCRH